MYLIYGIQKSGLSIVNYFENKKIKFKMWDDNPIVRKAIKKNYNKESISFHGIRIRAINFKQL